MTDEFEELVRSAGRTMTGPAEVPTYHDAWRRGRRRRLVKRSALAAAGALALVVAFSADLGRLPGGNSVEIDDVASDSVEAPGSPEPEFEPTASPVVPTTEPLTAPQTSGDDSADGSIAVDATAPEADRTPATDMSDDDAAASPTEPPQQVPTDTTPVPVPTTAVTPTPQPSVAPTPTPTLPPAVAAAAPTPTPDDDGRNLDTDSTPEPGSIETLPSDEPTVDPANPNGQTDGTDGGVDDTQPNPDEPPPVAFATDVPADASLALTGPAVLGVQPCDTDGDGVADAECRLLVEYRCESADQAREGFATADVDGDGVPDWCVPDVVTGCDVDGDGRADLPCVIRKIQQDQLDQENVGTVGP